MTPQARVDLYIALILLWLLVMFLAATWIPAYLQGV
jgi:hypothetical protein